MAGSGLPTYYWDTCCFLAWLMDETRPPGEMDALAQCVKRFKRGQVKIVTSVLTYTELTTAKLPAGMLERFEEVLQRPNSGKISVDIKVAKLARDLRNFYIDTRTDNLTITLPDSIHLASAIITHCDEFHTFDKHDKKKQNSLGLLPLDGNVAGYKLRIVQPSTAQLEIPGLIQDDEDAEEEPA